MVGAGGRGDGGLEPEGGAGMKATWATDGKTLKNRIGGKAVMPVPEGGLREMKPLVSWPASPHPLEDRLVEFRAVGHGRQQ